MHSTQKIREMIGWTQDLLANYLNITRSLLSLAETAPRSLSSTAELKWLEITKFVLSETITEQTKAQVEPDIRVPLKYEDFLAGKDTQIEAAVKEMLSEIRASK